MKKELFKAQLMALKNSLGEDASAFKEAIVAILTSMEEDTEKDYSKEDVLAMIDEQFKKLFTEENIPEEARNTISKMVTNVVALQVKEAVRAANSISKECPKAVRNEIGAAIAAARTKDEAKEAINAILTKNGVSGLDFAKQIDYAIVTKWGDEDELYAALNVTPIDEWFYSSQEFASKQIIAKAWTDTSTGEKAVQEIVATPKTISPDYVYKRQEVAKKLLAKLNKSGNYAQFVEWITNELRRINHKTQIAAILVGDQVNDEGKQLKMFETIKRSTTDIFVDVTTASGDYATIAEARASRDKVSDKGEIYAVMNRQQLTALAAFKYSENGTVHYRTAEEVAGELNVARIYVTDIVSAANGVNIIFLTPKEYWVNRDDIQEVAWPDYAHNKENWMYEEYTGGAIHGLESAAVILAKPATSTSGSKSGSSSK